MACTFEYNGKTYDEDGLAKALEQMPPHEASKYISGVKAVPDAPFKKNWHELALKRAIREAAENGYDRLSWTAGEHHPTNPKNLNQKGPEADAADKGMQGFYNNMLPKSVEKLTGQKVKTAKIETPVTLKDRKDFLSYARDNGLDNKTDAELNHMWMTEAPIVKKFMETKKPVTTYYIDLPQSVKDTALEKGFPLFSQTHMFSPVAGDPFKDENKK